MPVDDNDPTRLRSRFASLVDPSVQLLADVPISGAAEDLLVRQPFALRLVELACAPPIDAPRAVGLVGPSGSGKTSVIRMAIELLAQRGHLAVVSFDAASFTGAQALLGA